MAERENDVGAYHPEPRMDSDARSAHEGDDAEGDPPITSADDLRFFLADDDELGGCQVRGCDAGWRLEDRGGRTLIVSSSCQHGVPDNWRRRVTERYGSA